MEKETGREMGKQRVGGDFLPPLFSLIPSMALSTIPTAHSEPSNFCYSKFMFSSTLAQNEVDIA